MNLLSGGESIAHGLQELPKTKHILDRDLRAEAKTLFENAILLSLHGYFLEGSDQVQRSFSRSFLLKEPEPNSNAALKGLSLVIFNDMLHVRQFNPFAGVHNLGNLGDANQFIDALCLGLQNVGE